MGTPVTGVHCFSHYTRQLSYMVSQKRPLAKGGTKTRRGEGTTPGSQSSTVVKLGFDLPATGIHHAGLFLSPLPGLS